jgi:hypothetical protein
MSPCRHLHTLSIFALTLGSTLVASLIYAQTSNDPNEGLKLGVDPAITNGYQVSWWGRSGRTYFLQRSEDLTGRWSYFPLIENGQDSILSYGFINASPMHFVRVIYLNQILSDPYNTDTDGDGLTNQQEFTAETDPFDIDSDSDGMPDGYELAHGLNPTIDDGLADQDGDGVPNYRDSTIGELTVIIASPLAGASFE